MEKNKPIWSRLLKMKCPKCNLELISSNSGTRAIGCPDEENCGFYMRQEAFDRVVKSLYEKKDPTKGYKPKFGDDVATLEFLNNYGHNQQSADFSGDDTLGEQESDIKDWD